MENIFQGAKFGDKFLTRDGRVAIFYDFSPNKEVCRLLYKNEGLMMVYTNNGRFYQGNHDNYDIVSRYQEPIDFDKLHELANKLCPLEGFSNAEEGFIDEREDIENSWVDGFKAGYRKAIEG